MLFVHSTSESTFWTLILEMVMLSNRHPAHIESRLDPLASETGRTKSDISPRGGPQES